MPAAGINRGGTECQQSGCKTCKPHSLSRPALPWLLRCCGARPMGPAIGECEIFDRVCPPLRDLTVLCQWKPDSESEAVLTRRPYANLRETLDWDSELPIAAEDPRGYDPSNLNLINRSSINWQPSGWGPSWAHGGRRCATPAQMKPRSQRGLWNLCQWRGVVAGRCSIMLRSGARACRGHEAAR